LQNLRLCRKRGRQTRIFQELRTGVRRFQEVLQLPQKTKKVFLAFMKYLLNVSALADAMLT